MNGVIKLKNRADSRKYRLGKPVALPHGEPLPEHLRGYGVVVTKIDHLRGEITVATAEQVKS